MLVCKLRWQNADLFGVGLLECLWIHRWRFTVFPGLDKGTTRRNPRRYWPPQDFILGLLLLLGSTPHLHSASEQSSPMDLAELWLVSTGVRVDIEGLHLVVINSWPGIPVSVSEEGWLSEVGGHAAIRQEARCQLELLQFNLQLFLLLRRQVFDLRADGFCRLFLRGGIFDSGGAVII